MSTEPATRKRGPGRPFEKGMSGNPLGRTKEHAAVKALAQQYGEQSIKGLAEIAFGKHQAEYKDAGGKTRKRMVYDPARAVRGASPAAADGKPVLMLPIAFPYAFMLMETALVITGGSQVMRCAECGTVFITGSGTGRRGTSLYCSNRCRVAAQRSRKSTPASSSGDVMTDEEKLDKIALGVRGAARE
jgi:hypothetical protein